MSAQDIEKTCAHCGNRFSFRPTKRNPDRTCCSVECSNSYRAKLHNAQKLRDFRQCAYCGQRFEPSRPDALCCSVTCSNRHRSDGKEIIKCEECGTTFEGWVNHKRRFCSIDCHRRNINKQRFGPRPEFVCAVCGKVFSPPGRQRKPKCCSLECRTVYYTGPNSPTWKGGWSPYYGPNWHRQKRKARERDGHCCRHCGATEAQNGKALDVHHIKPFRTFQGDYIAANQLVNLVSLCTVCHKLAEFGRISVTND